MDTADMNSVLRTNPAGPFKAAATFWRASTEWFNLYMVFAGVFISVCLLIILIGSLLQGALFQVVLAALFLVLAIGFLVLQIWGMYTLSIEITEQGIRHKVSFQEIFIEWNKIDAVKFEPFKKQVTFWLNGKLTRIHDFGLQPSDSAIIKAAIMEQVKARNIKVK